MSGEEQGYRYGGFDVHIYTINELTSLVKHGESIQTQAKDIFNNERGQLLGYHIKVLAQELADELIAYRRWLISEDTV